MASPVAELKPLRKRKSYEILPPDLSELRLVLLGNSWSQRSSVGNLLLGKTEFTKASTQCAKGRDSLRNTTLTVTNSEDLLQPTLTPDRLTQFTTELATASAPGPHVLLLVLQPEDLTEQHKNRLLSVLESFSEHAFDHSLVLISTPRTETPGSIEKYMNDPQIRDIIIKCKYRYLHQKNMDVDELLTRVGQIVKENNGEHMSLKADPEEDKGLTMMVGHRSQKSLLNLVLCGKRETQKSSVLQSILEQAEVCGHRMSLVELLALSGKPLQAVMKESLNCISRCGPAGVHAFILVLPVGPLTNEDKAETEMFMDIFGSQVRDFTVVLFTVESNTNSAVNLHKDSCVNIEGLCESCRGGSLCLNIRDKEQVLEVIKTIDSLTEGGAKAFTHDMFMEAQIDKIAKLNENPERNLLSQMELRLVLIGQSFSGKRDFANTVLGTTCFKRKDAPTKANFGCEKVCGTVGGRHVAIVNTPPLFDKSFNTEELSKCFSLLAPGPHAFLLLLPIGNISREYDGRSLDLIKEMFGKKAADFALVVFTKDELLGNQPFESCIEECEGFVKDILKECQGRYLSFNINDDNNHTQVSELLQKIDKMVLANCGLTKEMFDIEKIEKRTQLSHERRVKELRHKITEGNKKLELKDKQLKENNDRSHQERLERKKEQEEEAKRHKRQEEMTRLEGKRKLDDAERRVRMEVEERRRVEKQLEQLRRENERRRQDWDRERKDILENRCEELKQNLEVMSNDYKRLQEEYLHKRKKWTYILFVLLLFSLFLGYYILMGR